MSMKKMRTGHRVPKPGTKKTIGQGRKMEHHSLYGDQPPMHQSGHSKRRSTKAVTRRLEGKSL